MSIEFANFTVNITESANLLFQLAKEYKKLNRRNTPAEIILVGGAAIVSKYGFRASTTDIDSLIFASSSMKDAINTVGDRNDLPTGWINEDFKKTKSFTEKIRQYSKILMRPIQRYLMKGV